MDEKNKIYSYAIVGGSDAGISAAMRIKELYPNAHMKIFLKDDYPNYSICGIPFYLSREIKDWHRLAHRNRESIELSGIKIYSNEEVTSIDIRNKKVCSKKSEYTYDKLLLATGAQSVIPEISGLDLPGVYTLRWIDDMLAIEQFIMDQNVNGVTIIGGGYIGVEMADALRTRGLEVTIIETSSVILKTLDHEFGRRLEDELKAHGVNIIHETRIRRILKKNTQLLTEDDSGIVHKSELVLVATGVRPHIQLLQDSGITVGKWGAYRVNRFMETNLEDVYAAGDCVETWHSYLKQYVYLPLGSTAHKQGRIAGENMVGNKTIFEGSLGTQVVKVFNLVAGRTGLHDRDCISYQLASKTIESEHWDHKEYYPDAKKMFIRITANPETRTLLGLQIIGSFQSEVSKRLDIAATAIQNRMTVDQLSNLDLSYTPPLSGPWDPIQVAAQAWLKEIKSDF